MFLQQQQQQQQPQMQQRPAETPPHMGRASPAVEAAEKFDGFLGSEPVGFPSAPVSSAAAEDYEGFPILRFLLAIQPT